MPRLNLRRASLEALVGLFASTAVAEAQELSSIPPNARVRIDFPAAERSRFERIGIGHSQTQSVAGRVEAVRADTLLLVVRSGDEPLRIPRAAIRSVYVSGGHPPRWRAALDGALVPALVTAALSAAGATIHRKPGDPTPAEAAVSGALWVGASSALLSAWHPKERWRPIRQATPSAR
jgi:hypothetical protein